MYLINNAETLFTVLTVWVVNHLLVFDDRKIIVDWNILQRDDYKATVGEVNERVDRACEAAGLDRGPLHREKHDLKLNLVCWTSFFEL